jgi:transglutaminase-like putative cysteine protease
MNAEKDCLRPTPIIDCDHVSIREKAEELSRGQKDSIQKARSLFRFVRDEIKYNPYLPRYLPEHFRASGTLARKEGFCVQKAVLLAALCRAVGIPARLRFAVIRNYLLPERVAALVSENLLPDHGYTELFLNKRWVKATPALDAGTCQKMGINLVEFDGERDAKFHSHTLDGRLHIEYVLDRGSYEDVPVDAIREWLLPVLKPEGRLMILGDACCGMIRKE